MRRLFGQFRGFLCRICAVLVCIFSVSVFLNIIGVVVNGAGRTALGFHDVLSTEVRPVVISKHVFVSDFTVKVRNQRSVANILEPSFLLLGYHNYGFCLKRKMFARENSSLFDDPLVGRINNVRVSQLFFSRLVYSNHSAKNIEGGTFAGVKNGSGTRNRASFSERISVEAIAQPSAIRS